MDAERFFVKVSYTLPSVEVWNTRQVEVMLKAIEGVTKSWFALTERQKGLISWVGITHEPLLIKIAIKSTDSFTIPHKEYVFSVPYANDDSLVNGKEWSAAFQEEFHTCIVHIAKAVRKSKPTMPKNKGATR